MLIHSVFFFLNFNIAVRRLLKCKDDITGHLQSYHLSKLVGNVEAEHDVILMRAGKFDVDLPKSQVQSRS